MLICSRSGSIYSVLEAFTVLTISSYMLICSRSGSIYSWKHSLYLQFDNVNPPY